MILRNSVWSNHQVKTCHYKWGISQCSFPKNVAIHFWKWFTAKESLLGVKRALHFRRQPALWEVGQNLRHGRHVPCRPHRSSLNPLPGGDTQYPVCSCSSPRRQNLLGLHTLPCVPCSEGHCHKSEGREQHSPPVSAQWLVSNQLTETHFLWVFPKDLMLFP